MLYFIDAAETLGLLRAVAPACREPDAWAPHLATAMHRFGIANDKDFVAAFIAQLMVESAELSHVVENLDYSAPRLCQVWPKRFASIEFAKRYEHRPRELANYVYANRLGNGPSQSDEGWLYRGRGPIQNTGKRNYQALETALGLPLVMQPDLLLEKGPGALAAAKFWWDHRLSFLAADLPGDEQAEDFETITRRINGATHGLAKRQAYWRKARAHLGLPEVST